MFGLTDITLFQFKNYQDLSLSFGERVTALCGKNGIGKTNLLDAIYYLCFTKSYFTRTDVQNVKSGTLGFRLHGTFQGGQANHTVTCILRENGKKEFLLNDEPYFRLSDHIGKLPAVMIAPDDVRIITETSEERRRFLDALLSQLDHQYLLNLINYNKILQQRNSVLKSFADTRRIDHNLLEVLDDQLTDAGTPIFEKRRDFLRRFIPVVQRFYRDISGETYEVSLQYQSQLHHSSFFNLLYQFREKDLVLQRTGAGIHKDDIDISLGDTAFKTIASQGQRKSMLFALKLAEFEILRENKRFAPILLLDDVFEKLDAARMQNLLQWVCGTNSGQLFITDTHQERLNDHLRQLDVGYEIKNL